MRALNAKADEIIAYLHTLPEVKSCELYGSIANGNADKFSDIDICVDVSGCDNGTFMKTLPQLMKKRFLVIWHDYALSLVPEQYVVSIALDEKNPFCVVDLKCIATPHVSIIKKEDINNDPYFHLIKLWVVNLKHYIRGTGCTRDIQKMGRRTIGDGCVNMSNAQILEEILHRLNNNVTSDTAKYISSCKKVWDLEGLK